jgi:hypothetical protein
MYDDYSLKEKIALKAKLLNDFVFFVRFFFKETQGIKFLLNWHHKEICDNLIELTKTNKIECLNINIPPRYSKTELAAVMFIPFILANNPRANFLYITASDDLRSEVSIRIRDIITSKPYKELFGVELKQDQNGKNLWRTTAGGGLKTATIFGQITGFGAGKLIDTNKNDFEDLSDYLENFYGTIILDDVNKIDDADMENAFSQKVARVIMNTVMSRKNTKSTQIINIQQRSGIEDATATLQKYYENNPEKCKTLIYKVIHEDKPLWEIKHNLEQINQMAENPLTKRMFQCQYMQDPQPKEGLLFAASELQYFNLDDIDIKNNEIIKASFTDTANGSDYFCTAYAIILKGLAYIIDVMFNQEKHSVNRIRYKDFVNKHNISFNVLESNGEGHQFALDQGENNFKNTSNRIIPRLSRGDKQQRIKAREPLIVSKFVFRKDVEMFSEYYFFMKNLTSYVYLSGATKNKNDDAPDACAGLGKFLQDEGVLK